MRRDIEWFDLSGGHTGCVSYSRIAKRARFIVLSPAKEPGRLCPTLCAGDFVDGRCVLDHGTISLSMLAELESFCELSLSLDALSGRAPR